jgi:hypothetical protein
LDECEVIGGKPVVARRDPTTLFDLIEEPLDPVAGAVEIWAETDRIAAIAVYAATEAGPEGSGALLAIVVLAALVALSRAKFIFRFRWPHRLTSRAGPVVSGSCFAPRIGSKRRNAMRPLHGEACRCRNA